MTEEYQRVVNEFCEVGGRPDEDYNTLNCMEIARLERIADALESINYTLEGLATTAEAFEQCIGYIPPMFHQKEGSHIFRIGGSVDTE